MMYHISVGWVGVMRSRGKATGESFATCIFIFDSLPRRSHDGRQLNMASSLDGPLQHVYTHAGNLCDSFSFGNVALLAFRCGLPAFSSQDVSLTALAGSWLGLSLLFMGNMVCLSVRETPGLALHVLELLVGS
jgi:hypothetical protein